MTSVLFIWKGQSCTVLVSRSTKHVTRKSWIMPTSGKNCNVNRWMLQSVFFKLSPKLWQVQDTINAVIKDSVRKQGTFSWNLKHWHGMSLLSLLICVTIYEPNCFHHVYFTLIFIHAQKCYFICMTLHNKIKSIIMWMCYEISHRERERERMLILHYVHKG